MKKVETVRVADGKDFKIINKSDYDEKTHGKILPEPKPKAEPKTQDPE